MLIQYIQPRKLNQNTYIERFNRTYRNEVLNLYLFRCLEEVLRSPGTGSENTMRNDPMMRWAVSRPS